MFLEKVKRALYWFRIADPHDGQLSLTNLAAVVAIWKFAWLKDFTLPELAAFFLSLLAYAVKSHRRARGVTDIHEQKLGIISEAVEGIKSRLSKAGVADALNRRGG